MEGVEPQQPQMQPQQIQDPAAALVELQQQFELQAQELERIRKEKEDAELAAQMQTQAALNTAGPSSGKVEGVRPPSSMESQGAVLDAVFSHFDGVSIELRH